MALLQTQDFEGQTSGTTITAGNSGTAPSTAYTTVNTGTAATVQYDNAHPAHGTNAGKFATAATSTTVNGLQTFTGVATVYGRFYIYSTDWTSSQQFGARLRASGTQTMRIVFDSTGHVTFKDTANSSSGMPVGSVALSNATYYRVEFTCTPGTSTTGAATANVYLGDSVTLLDSITITTANFGTAAITEYGVGLFTATANVSAFWIDDTNVNDSALPGPVVTTTAVSDSDTGTGVDGGESIAATVAGTETGTGADAGESIAATVSDADTAAGADAQSLATVTLPGQPFLDQYVSGYNLYTGLGFGVDTTTAVGTWVLTDVTADVLQADGTQGIVIQRGRLDEFSQTSPASAVFTLKNGVDGGNGDYSPRRPTGAHWPYVVEGTPCQVAILTASHTYEQFAGFVAEYAPDFDESGNYSTVTVTAYGSLQQVQQGQKPLRSAMFRAMSKSTLPLLAYWPMEDGNLATSCAPYIGPSAMIAIAGTASFGAAGGGGVAASVDMSNSVVMYGAVPKAAAATSWRLMAAFAFTGGTGKTYYPMYWTTTAGDTWLADFNTVGGTTQILNLSVIGPSGSVTQAFATPWSTSDAGWHSFQVCAVQNGGNVDVACAFDDLAWHTATSMLTGYTLSAVRAVLPGADQGVPADSRAITLAHVGVSSPTTINPTITVPDLGGAVTGYLGESPITRLTRLFAEENIIFAADGTSTKTMGPQTAASLSTLVREAEDVDGGVLEDGVGFGCFMRTAGVLANGAAVISTALTNLVLPFKPLENNSKVVNDAIVSRLNGGTAEYIQPAGQPYAPTGVGGVGYLEVPYTLNLQNDTQLLNRAGWYVHLGTVDEDRYSSLSINLARKTALLPSWLACVLGSRATITGNYATGGVNGADVLLEGWTITLSRLIAKVVANCSPAVAWFVAAVDDAALGRVTGSGTTLHTGISAGATSLTADAPSPWTTTALRPGDLPLDINLNGEQVTVGVITGASTPYTFSSLTRSVNGVSKTHSAGAPIDIWRPGVVGL